jgi:hypothetical protein
VKESNNFQGLRETGYNRRANAQQTEGEYVDDKMVCANSVVVSVVLVTALSPIATEASSESDRLEKLERAVEQLQKRNAELEAEVRGLKQQTAAVPGRQIQNQGDSGRKNVCRESCPPTGETTSFCATAGTGIETGIRRIHPDEF